MDTIKFGTNGWHALIAKGFTVENVARVAEATAQWLLKNFEKPSVVLGYDTRFGGKLFSRTVAKILAHHTIKVFFTKDFVSTPMVSLGVVNMKASIGIMITAGQHPHTYSGIKLKDSYGGPMFSEKVQEIEAFIQEYVPIDIEKLSINYFETHNLIKYIDLETMYCNHIEKNFNLSAIRTSGLRLAYDAMFGAGQNIIKRLLPNTVLLHCKNNPSFNGQVPEPIHKNLSELSQLMKTSNFDCGIATDGDGERIGLYDGNGKVIDYNHIILVFLKYLYEYKGIQGKSEGIISKGPIPERDGIWVGLTILEYMAKTGRSLQELIREVYEVEIRYQMNSYKILDDYKIQRLENTMELTNSFKEDELLMAS